MSSWGTILAYYRNGIAKIICPFCNHEFIINTKEYRISKYKQDKKLTPYVTGESK